MVKKVNLDRLLKGNNSLRSKAIFGSQWSLFSSMSKGLIDFVRAAIFARVLFPEDYGLIALATLSIGFLQSFSTIGLEVYIVKEKECDNRLLEICWTIKFIRGVALAIVSWLIAPLIAAFFDETRLTWIIRLLALTFIFDGFAGFGREIRRRQLDFRKLAVVESASSLVLLILGLAVLYYTKSFWALVFYQIFFSISIPIISHLLYPWRPHFAFDYSVFKKLIVFSASIIIIEIMNYVLHNYDRSIIGKIFGIDELGLYARAHFLASASVLYFFSPISRVLLPAFRKTSENRDWLKSSFSKTFVVYLVAALLILAFLSLSGKYVVILVYGQKWMPIMPVFKILILYGAIKGISQVCIPIFYIHDRPWLNTICAAVAASVFGLVCYPMILKYKLIGAAMSLVLSTFISLCVALFFSVKLVYFDKQPEISN